MRLTIAYSKIKKRNLVLINNDTYQRETLSERPIRQPLIEVSNLKNLWHMCDIYNCDYLQHNTFRLNLIDFKLNRDFPSQFCVFYRKIT